MKVTRLLLCIFVLTVAAHIGCKQESLTITGSETMYPMLKIIEKDYEEYQDRVDLVVKGGGSKFGLKKLVVQETDMASSSLDIREIINSRLALIDNFEIAVVAMDGIAVVVNRENPVDRLHLLQLSDIFSGKITNWKEVGGADMPIKVIIRNDNSGTAAYMKEHILRQMDMSDLVYEKKKFLEYDKDVVVAKNNREIAQLIEKNKNAISYMGMGSAVTEGEGKVKKLEYAIDEDGPYYKPTITSIESRDYRLARPLTLIFRVEKDPEIKDFLEYLNSKRAHESILSSGYKDSLHSRFMLETILVTGKRPIKKD